MPFSKETQVSSVENNEHNLGGSYSDISDDSITHESWNTSDYPPHSIAVVGMAGKFPEADSVEELWDLLLDGKSVVKPAPVERLQLPQTGSYSDTKWWGNFLKDPDAFDHRFFKKPSREAVAWDPQQRILLEVLYQALESAGYFGPSSENETNDYGCYVGAVMNNYYDNLSCHPPTAYATPGTSRPFLSGVMSHHFGWTGPALTIDTACSSSLVAINTACRAIWSGECSRAIAAGTNVITSPFDYQNLNAAGFLSPTGQCKPFDAGADGYCRGEGVGVVVLKKLSDAVQENNNILGVIVGSAANQNQNFSHITVPHSGSQVELYHKAMKLGNVRPEEVSYVEAHGTGTGVGDPVEARSIRDALGGPHRDSILHFSSIKGNIGHTEASAGVSGLIKVLLMMKHGMIPKQASFNSLNPKISALNKDRMAIPTKNLWWKAPTRVACVNSYGAAGSNSTLLVREKPKLEKPSAPVQLSEYPIFISAGSESSLSMYATKLLEWLPKPNSNPDQLLASLAFNLADRANHTLPFLFSTSVSNIQGLQSSLEKLSRGSGIEKANSSQPVVLIFGGQESDIIGLSQELYQSSPIFRKHLNHCDRILLSRGLDSVHSSLLQNEPINKLTSLHAALFSVQYASAKAWIDCGLKVDAVVGHSFGQLTAFCISGALSLSDALTLVVERASLMQKHWGSERGSMLSLQTDRRTVEEILRSLKASRRGFDAEIACYNGPRNHVVVGTADDIETIEQYINTSQSLRGSIRSKRLRVTHGFHSKFTEPMLPHLSNLAKTLDWREPTMHLETCDEISSFTEPGYTIVSSHTRSPVFFQQAIERLEKKFSKATWVEAGRGSSITQLAKDALLDSEGHLFIAPHLTSSNASRSLVDKTVELWKFGYSVQFWPFHRSQKPLYEHLDIPLYQFEKTRHWLPFLRQSSRQDSGKEEDKPVEDKHDLLTFLNFKDSHQKEAIFRIDPRSDRFQEMLAGHVMADQTLAPASLYLEVICRAALVLQKDTEATDYVPTVDDLRMKSPIGHDTTAEILLTLEKLGGNKTSWSFSITTQGGVMQRKRPYEHSTGVISLKRRDDAQAARHFKRFESLTGYRRCEAIFNNPDAETMQGNHIYRAFSTVVSYGPTFHGIKKVACVGEEAAGIVAVTPDLAAPADQRLCDTPMTDSFMQFAGFLVNYFNNPNLEDVFVCMEIEHIEFGGRFNPDAKEWVVYSNMTGGGDCDVSSDVYVFDAESKNMVMATFGLRFTKMQKAKLANLLKNVNKPEASIAKPQKTVPSVAEVAVPAVQTIRGTSPPNLSSKRSELIQVLSNITDVAIEEISPDSALEDLGIDSLMATEVLNDIRKSLGINIDLSSFLLFPSIDAIVAYIDEASGISSDDEPFDTPPTTDADSDVSGMSTPAQNNVARLVLPQEPSRPKIISSIGSFEEKRWYFDSIARENKAAGFWTEAYPRQARLVRAYVLEAFSALGCDLTSLRIGEHIPQVKTLDRHAKLVEQLYRVLEDGKLISPSRHGFVRTDVVVDETPAESIYQQIIGLHPQHDNVLKLIRAVGSRLAECLVGDEDGLQIVFGNKETKATLEAMYEFWPLLRTPTMVLSNFLQRAFTNAKGDGKFRILEVGAGTGGTTRYIVNALKSQGIPFEYVFTDISSSLVSEAKKKFKGIDEVSFDVVNIEKPIKQEYEEAFHCIIATNCIHATRNLEASLTNLRKMLREDGALTLIEITKNMFWLDIVVGLFEGWWLFEDGRSHALVNEKHWERVMKNSGFKEVLWSDGATPESETVRVIAAFPRGDPIRRGAALQPRKPANPVVETVVYKRIGNLDIHADIYYPGEGHSSNKKLPIALMIHGGSHCLFSRKQIRPAQTRLLLAKGFLPVSLDHRLCPEVSLSEGGMVDVCDALDWARHTLPYLDHHRPGLQIDGERVVVVGWSSGGQLAMSLGWTAPKRGLRPPEAVLSFYAPTNYEDEWWRHPIQPIGAEDTGYKYDVLEAIQDQPITHYDQVGAWEPLSEPRILTDPRCRVVLHINWKAQTLPIILGGLPSRTKANKSSEPKDWNALPQPDNETIVAASALAQIREGNYNTPTFLIHGTADDLVPWTQSRDTYAALVERGTNADLVLIENAPHICDLSSDPDSKGWKATVRGYEFLYNYVS